MKKWYAVLGDPVAQSMSPAMHDQWFKENGLNASYIPIHASDLKAAVDSLRVLGCSGFNVTVPHKQAVIPLLDGIDEAAERMNAVNTVYYDEENRLIGTNTDGFGFVRSLPETAAGKALIIGAGGAARGIAFALKDAGWQICITNRTEQKAQQLAEELAADSCTLAAAEARLAEFPLIVQTTTVGMNFASGGMPVNPANIQAGTIVADIIYNPLETEFLRAAKAKGAVTVNGVGMFVHQGALAFEKWTGINPDTETMNEMITMKVGG